MVLRLLGVLDVIFVKFYKESIEFATEMTCLNQMKTSDYGDGKD